MARKQRIWPGRPYPLGATRDAGGTNFALFSAYAERVELCLFDSSSQRETERITLPEYTHEIWHGYVPDLHAGQLYGYRVYGPYAPEQGHRFNHHKLLLDPYAKRLRGMLRWNDAVFGYVVGSEQQDLSFDKRDSAPFMPRCEVIDPAFEWTHGRLLRPWHETVVYELHVRGFTMLHPRVTKADRGTFGGLAAPQIIDYLTGLGITAVELLPVQAFIHDRHLVDKGLRNYWGYNTIGFFSPHAEYLGEGGLDEFRNFIEMMHGAGIEVILDVAYNHTAEGNQLGPTLSMKGIDNRSYYYLQEENARYYNDFTGTGNALELRHPYVLRMVTDSLRYWAEEMKVDGFRFDLTATLARVNGEFNEHASFLDSVAQDPLLSTVKLIAEPWDIGEGGYRLGAFPPGWAEWNDRYRDTLRRFWKGDNGQLAELATRLAGSGDLYDRRGRRPWASVNFIAVHDGFTLHDLVSYNEKHNEENLEQNGDGSDGNVSWNCGAEGPTGEEDIIRLREQQKRNLLASLLLSQGVPMLRAGDECGQTQNGNNNAYCQDNEITWLDWNTMDQNTQRLLSFVQQLVQLRNRHIVFHRHRFFHGAQIPGTKTRDIIWLRPDGEEMQEEDWNRESASSLALLISGEAGLVHLTENGEIETDDTFLLLMNASEQSIDYTLPKVRNFPRRRVILDTARAEEDGSHGTAKPKNPLRMQPRSLVLIGYAYSGSA